MAKSLVTVLADDLTGACEIAALGLKYGLKSAVATNLREYTAGADLVVYDTETRLDSPAFASAKLTSTLHLLCGDKRPEHLFKKTDSVLRGPVMAELNLLSRNLEYDRVILVPANPLLGRTIKGGYYRIHGLPVHESGFASDLHHPVTSSWVVDLLGYSSFLAVHRSSHQSMLPGKGLVIGDAESEEDLVEWTRHLDANTLPAGSAAFFEKILRQWTSRNISPPGSPFEPASPTLLVSGTTLPEQIRLLERRSGSAEISIPIEVTELERGISAVTERIAEKLRAHGRAIVHMRDGNRADPAKAYLVRTSLARIAHHFVAHQGIRHLIVEGGATAASISNELGWRTFEAVHEWAPGVVSLRPEKSSDLLFTMKPGSYPWPAAIQELAL